MNDHLCTNEFSGLTGKPAHVLGADLPRSDHGID
jgi:hypothetical protein